MSDLAASSRDRRIRFEATGEIKNPALTGMREPM
jgi:hypothetical protein